MVVKFMQKGDDVPIHTTRTIFSDVTSRHWALGYVNLAASLTIQDGDKEGGVKLVSGVGDGRFEPDAKISLAQAVTILIRMLGYTSQQTGAVWPQSYMNLAKSIGLTDGVNSGAYDDLTRAQAAQLFVNALECKQGDGSLYYKSLGEATEGVIVLAVDVEADDGSGDRAIRTSVNQGTEAYLTASGVTYPTALQGRRGVLVLNKEKEIVTFIPDESTSTSVTISGNAQPGAFRVLGGTEYPVSGSTLVYTADKRNGEPYSTAYSTLTSGTHVTLYLQQGKVTAIYVSGSGSSASDSSGVVIVSGSGGTAALYQLTGGVTNFTVLKNGQVARLSDIRPYDAVSYDSLTNTMVVSDLKLTCIYESAEPNSKAPTSITALGHKFDVLDGAWATIQNYDLGKQVTLLLTADGKVAGMADAQTVRSSAVGRVTSSGAEIFLPGGGTLTLQGTVPSAGSVQNQLAVISSGSKGVISATRLTGRTAPGPFRVGSMTLGNYSVAAGVRIYEQVSADAVAEVDLSTLSAADIPKEKIAGYHLNSSNMVDYIILDNATGDAYLYGMMVRGAGGDFWSLVNRQTTQFAATAGFAGRSGSFVGVVVDRRDGGESTSNFVQSSVELTQIRNVAATSFFTDNGVSYVRANGKVYRVSSDVECFHVQSDNRYSTENWLQHATGEARLNAIKAMASSLTIYLDPISEVVRIVEAG